MRQRHDEPEIKAPEAIPAACHIHQSSPVHSVRVDQSARSQEHRAGRLDAPIHQVPELRIPIQAGAGVGFQYLEEAISLQPKMLNGERGGVNLWDSRLHSERRKPFTLFVRFSILFFGEPNHGPERTHSEPGKDLKTPRNIS